MSSTLKIISAASVAEMRACSLTLRHSVIPIDFMQSTSPLNMFRPYEVLPFAIAALRFWTISALSYPALSAMMVGSYLSALEKASMARDYFPSTEFASSDTARAILISAFPPP